MITVTNDQRRVLTVANELSDEHVMFMLQQVDANLEGAFVSLKTLCDLVSTTTSRETLINASNALFTLKNVIDTIVEERAKQAQMKEYGTQIN
jgi:hypothetical protein